MLIDKAKGSGDWQPSAVAHCAHWRPNSLSPYPNLANSTVISSLGFTLWSVVPYSQLQPGCAQILYTGKAFNLISIYLYYPAGNKGTTCSTDSALNLIASAIKGRSAQTLQYIIPLSRATRPLPPQHQRPWRLPFHSLSPALHPPTDRKGSRFGEGT